MTREIQSDFEDFRSGMDVGMPVLHLNHTITADDERLLRETFALDPKEGCALLFRRYYHNLCSHAIRFVHSKEIAEDIVSELFASFWQDGIFEQINSSYRAYLYKSVRHRAYNYLKWKVQQTDSLDTISSTKASAGIHPDEALLFSELHVKVESIIQQLPPQCRRAYLLKRVEGKKYDDIANEMKISVKAVEALVSRALSRLRSELKESWFLGLLLASLC